MKRLYTIHYQFAFPSSFIDHSYTRVFRFCSSLIHTRRYINRIRTTGMRCRRSSLCVYEHFFFFIFSVNKKKQRYLSFLLSFTLCMILPPTSILGYMSAYYNRELDYTYSSYNRYLYLCMCVHILHIIIIGE